MGQVKGYGISNYKTMLYRFIYIIGRGCIFLSKRLEDFFWYTYLKAYCKSRKEIKVSDISSLQFNGKTLIAVSSGSDVRIGKNVVINSSYHTVSPSVTKIDVGGILTIGDNSGISSSVIICKDRISIGKSVNIGAGCLILDTNMHSTDWKIRANRKHDNPVEAKKAPVVIADNVFIGARCIINKGVTIGEKSMIAAGSVVVKDIPANCMAGGNPCKVIKYIVDD